jgi:hypothetical protein
MFLLKRFLSVIPHRAYETRVVAQSGAGRGRWVFRTGIDGRHSPCMCRYDASRLVESARNQHGARGLGTALGADHPSTRCREPRRDAW